MVLAASAWAEDAALEVRRRDAERLEEAANALDQGRDLLEERGSVLELSAIALQLRMLLADEELVLAPICALLFQQLLQLEDARPAPPQRLLTPEVERRFPPACTTARSAGVASHERGHAIQAYSECAAGRRMHTSSGERGRRVDCRRSR